MMLFYLTYLKMNCSLTLFFLIYLKRYYWILFRLLSHVNDPKLDDPEPQEFIIYLCPVGEFLANLLEYWDHTLQLCGWNSAHIYQPHITLCSFFKVIQAQWKLLLSLNLQHTLIASCLKEKQMFSILSEFCILFKINDFFVFILTLLCAKLLTTITLWFWRKIVREKQHRF